MLFIDFKAYDIIVRNKLILAMNEMGLPRKLVRSVKCTMVRTLNRVKCCGVENGLI